MSAAVTVTVTTLFPATRASAPTTTYVASGSSVSTVTSADSVKGSRLKVPPSTTSSPFTWKDVMFVFTLNATTNVTV